MTETERQSEKKNIFMVKIFVQLIKRYNIYILIIKKKTEKIHLKTMCST